jgi:hypothetical protein
MKDYFSNLLKDIVEEMKIRASIKVNLLFMATGCA